MKANLNRTATAVMLGATAVPAIVAARAVKAGVAEPQRPNIVFIMTDDHTAQMMSAYDRRHISTPNLDRIASNGVKFVNSFVANSLSGPSRACILTGKHSHANGFTDNETCVFDGDQPTFPKYLQKAGYQTAIFGKWHLFTLPQGFDKWEIVPGQGQYYNPDFITMDNDTVRVEGYLTNIITDKALGWLERERNREQPFMLMIHHKAIHRNWLPDTCDLALYEDKVFEVPENFFDDYEGRQAAAAAEMRIADNDHMDITYDNKMVIPGLKTRLGAWYKYMLRRMGPEARAKFEAHYQPIIDDFSSRSLEGDSLALWKYQRYMRDYAKVVASLDRNVGRVLDYLRDNGMLDNTLVVYTSDQGFYMGEHGWFDKRFMYEESLNTPLVMMLPAGYERRGDIPEMVQNIDFAPTFMEMAGYDSIPGDIQGRSLLPLLRDNKAVDPDKWRDFVYYHYHEYPAEHAVKRHYGIRTDRYTLMHFYNDIDAWELYDLQQDPMQMHNIYGAEGTQELTDRLMERLRYAMELYDDPIRFNSD